MHYDPRHLASLMIAAAGIVAPMPASAVSAEPQAIELAQESPPPPDAAAPVEAPAPPPVEQKKRRDEQPAVESPPVRQRIERGTDDEQPRRERQPERARQQQDQDQQRIERQQEAERVREDRAQEKARQDQVQSDERAKREAERNERQQEAERVREERAAEKVRQDQLQSKESAQREAERAAKQEADRVGEERAAEKARQDQLQSEERAQREAEQAKKQEADRVGEERAAEKARQDQLQNQEGAKRDAERAAPRDDERRRLREQAPPVATQPVPVPVPAPNGAGVPPVVPANDRQQQRQEERRSRDAERAAPRDDERRRWRERAPPVATPPAATTGVQTQQPPGRVRQPEIAVSPIPNNIRENYRRAPKQQRSFDDLRRNRRERTISQGNLRVIEEPDRRVIVKQNNRSFIRHDESERFRRIAPDARTIRGADGTSTTFMTRRGGVRIYDVSDRNGRLLHRYRRYPNGREVILIDNRGHYRRDKSRTRDVLIGAGIGLVVGSAIALAAPKVRIPRDEYIVDYGRASDDDLYEALTAPPLERLDRGYSLDEVRYSSNLRDRMRRIDLDTVTFDFGSWEVGPDQGRALDRLADGINRVLQRNPDEIFMIEGHTDAVGTQDDNLTLSDRRAQSVAEILTTEYGVAPENLVTQGYGEEQLKIPTDGPERLNRRITVRRIGPLLSGQFEEERYSGAAPANDRIDEGDRGYEDLDDGPPDDGLPAVVPPDDGRTYDYDNDRYR